MPSSKVKAKNAAAHQHDKRHESGLAAPGKRVVRQQRSHTNLAHHANGQLNGRPAALADTHAAVATGVELHHEQPRTTDGYGAAKCREDVECERERRGSDASHDGMAYQHGELDDVHPDDMVYFPSVDHSRHATSAPANTSSMVSTILTYYPLRDAISILILLLSLPATLVLVIQTLFASLTFVPPTIGISLPSIKEMFNASSLGYPALATILFVDLLFYLCWLPLWRPVQNVLLDLSQAVVAVSLSGAAAQSGGPTYSIATCSALVCVVHVLRYKAIHLTALDYLRSVLGKTDFGINLSASFMSNSFLSTINPIEHSSIYSAIRTTLGIHILSQGVTTCVRRFLASQNEKPATVPALTRIDTDAAVNEQPPRNAAIDPTSMTSTPPNGLAPISRDTRARDSGRKRRKQAIEIRGNQPLWAAIASTKVTFVKEMEQRDAVEDAREAHLMDKLAVIDSAVSLKPVFNRIWLSSVRDTEVSLCAALAADSTHGDVSSDAARAFCVRVNGAIWNSIKTTTIGDHISLEIFGLAPHTSYKCGIYAADTVTLLCTVSFVTQVAQTEHVATIAAPPPVQSTLRPSSPASTLRRSIEQASANLAEAKNKTKKSRKDQRAAYSDIRKEIKDLKSKLDNGGGNDDRQSRRLQQFTQHKNQAEDAAIHINRQIDELGELPAEDIAEADVSKQQWNVAHTELSAAQKHHDGVKSAADRDARELKDQIAMAELKRERLSHRHQQRKEELATIAAKHQAELTARQKHSLERAARRDEQEKLEAQLRFHVAAMNGEAEMHNTKAIEAYQQGQALQVGWHDHSSPPTPDNVNNVANGISQALANGFYGTQHFDVPYVQQQPAHAPRARSSSMLSHYSGFTDEDVEDGSIRLPHDPSWPLQKTGFGTAVIDIRKESAVSSGSSGTNESTASSSPRPGVLARPFVPSKMSPIAPPARKTASPQTNTHVPTR